MRCHLPTRSSATSCCSWLQDHEPPAIEVAATAEEAETLREWQRTLHAAHWVGIHWPVEYGGRGASRPQVAIYNEELRARRRAAAPRAGGPDARRADVDGARNRGATRRGGCRGSSAPTTCGASCSASPARAATSRASRRVRAEERRRVPRDRAEGVVVVRDLRRHGDRAGAHRSGRAAAQGDLDARAPDGREGRRRAPAAPDDGRLRVQRGLLRRGRGAGREPHRSGERGLAGREHDARQRARRLVRVEGAGAARGGERSLRQGVRPPGDHERPVRAPATRAVVDRRRDLPPAQRAHAATARRAARRSARSRAS